MDCKTDKQTKVIWYHIYDGQEAKKRTPWLKLGTNNTGAENISIPLRPTIQ